MKHYFLLLSAALAFYVLPGCEKDGTVEYGSPTPHDFLSAEEYTGLSVELLYVEGYAPLSTSIDNLVDFMQERLHKPAGIDIVEHSFPSPGDTHYSTEEIRNIENDHRTVETEGSQLSLFIVFVDGEYAENSGDEKVLGISYDNSSIAIFKQTVMDYSGGLTEPSETVLETSILLHEFGHVLGLVNNGTPMQTLHEDQSHRYHCNVESCLMYWLLQNTSSISNLVGGNVPELDAQCKADLKANGGK